MLRVGLTGGLGSGKTIAAQRFAELGAQVLYADEIARGLMEPGQKVHQEIVASFGNSIVAADGKLDRPLLARTAFGERRIEELNAIIHPATIARQAELIAEIETRNPHAVVIVESALVFETRHGGVDAWRSRFDRIILVRAAESTKLARFVERMSAGVPLSETRRRQLEEDAGRLEGRAQRLRHRQRWDT